MTKYLMFFKNPRQDIKFINKSGIPISNILSKLLSPCLEPPSEPTDISSNVLIDKLDNKYRHNFDCGINNTTQHSIIFLRIICSCPIQNINSNTIVLFFANVSLIKGRVISPNVVNIPFLTFHLKDLLTFEVWINRIFNFKIFNTFFCFVYSNKTFSHMK